jgi:hypothetical protein
VRPDDVTAPEEEAVDGRAGTGGTNSETEAREEGRLSERRGVLGAPSDLRLGPALLVGVAIAEEDMDEGRPNEVRGAIRLAFGVIDDDEVSAAGEDGVGKALDDDLSWSAVMLRYLLARDPGLILDAATSEALP